MRRGRAGARGLPGGAATWEASRTLASAQLRRPRTPVARAAALAAACALAAGTAAAEPKPQAGTPAPQANAAAAEPAAKGPAGAPAAKAPATAWSQLVSAEAHFAVRMPGTPEVASSPVGAMDMRVFSASAGPEGPAYLVIYMGLDAVPDDKLGDPAAELAGMGPQLAAKFEGKLVREGKAEIPGAQGRDFLVETKDGAQVAVRVVYARKRMYQLIVLAKGALPAAEAEAFFASLRLDP